jgi:hypothetical protein
MTAFVNFLCSFGQILSKTKWLQLQTTEYVSKYKYTYFKNVLSL